jgi:DNA-binding MarR family transcriptional regulator
VHREPDPHDRRAAAVTMTPDGRTTYEQASEWLHEILTIVAADLDDHDLRALDRLRDPLNAGMDRARARLRHVRRP